MHAHIHTVIKKSHFLVDPLMRDWPLLLFFHPTESGVEEGSAGWPRHRMKTEAQHTQVLCLMYTDETERSQTNLLTGGGLHRVLIL